MNLLNRKAFKCFFRLVCAIVVAFMVGYWLYKYEIEDRDIGVVDYAPLQDANEIEFPVISLCFMNPFLSKQFRASNSNITMETYRQYLEGNVYDDIFENLEYSNLTLDLEKYFLSGQIFWQNETYDMKISEFISHSEVFSGFDQSEF